MSAHMTFSVQSSSSEDEAENERLKAAVWNQSKNDGKSNFKRQRSSDTSNIMRISQKPSIRQQINEEYYDQFNEDHKNVNATPEFRSFVAKKLSNMLDGSLKSVPVHSVQPKINGNGGEDDDEGIFKLLSTSCSASNPLAPVNGDAVRKRRPPIRRKRRKLSPTNSDDSDVEDQRLAEAAVSGLHILGASAILVPSTLDPAPAVAGTLESLENSKEGGHSGSPAKVEAVQSSSNAEGVEASEDADEDGSSGKRKKKKKGKRKKVSSAENSGLKCDGSSVSGSLESTVSQECCDRMNGEVEDDAAPSSIKKNKNRKKDDGCGSVKPESSKNSASAAEFDKEGKTVKLEDVESFTVKRKKKKKKKRLNGNDDIQT